MSNTGNGYESSDPPGMGGEEQDSWVVQTISTGNPIFRAPDDTEFSYFYMDCARQPGTANVKLLLNPALVVGLMSDMTKMLKVMFGVIDSESIAKQLGQVPDEAYWETMPPPPNDPMDRDQDPPYGGFGQDR